MAADTGFEPVLPDSESGVLPLDESATRPDTTAILAEPRSTAQRLTLRATIICDLGRRIGFEPVVKGVPGDSVAPLRLWSWYIGNQLARAGGTIHQT